MAKKGKKKGRRKSQRGKAIRQLGKGIIGKPPKALRPTSRKKHTKQAKKTMASIFAPAYAELEGQEKTLRSVDAKRTRDNKYYLDWLGSQTKQIQAHSRTADAQILETQKEIADTANAATSGMRDKLVEQAGQHSQTVSNAQKAAAFDTTPEVKRSGELVAAERQRTASSVEGAEKSRQVNVASNFAQQAASEARRVSDLWTGLKDVASAKNQVKLEQAAETAKEVARLLDTEITKAQSKMELRGMGVDAALQVKRLRLDKKLAQAQIGADAREGRKERRHERKESKRERQHESKESKKDRQADKGGGDGKGKKKREAARKSARQLVKQLGPAKAKKNKKQLIDEVMSQTGVGYNAALQAVNQALKRGKKKTDKGGSGDPSSPEFH